MNALKKCVCTGGQALDLVRSGFKYEALVKVDTKASNTLRLNADLKKGSATVANHA